MLFKHRLAVFFLMLSALYSPLLRAETEQLAQSEPSVMVFAAGLAVLAALSLYVALKIRNTIRNHLDKPAK
ncbi:hypothetical protein [Acinetobacter tianfuensis]|uniref:Uncharacterized protein n=1 Tax=Acinetobacter tianfuensis TaxID=2419603 RepID=A0A3A8E293_9GAMM|nr:hypothetical protein [Acinetobacter tianfuensis]RKG29292.1 hypothetical protein D7V32_15595 [Acinetobacter tianfuensis]